MFVKQPCKWCLLCKANIFQIDCCKLFLFTYLKLFSTSYPTKLKQYGVDERDQVEFASVYDAPAVVQYGCSIPQ